jgi:hypothetical protein
MAEHRRLFHEETNTGWSIALNRLELAAGHFDVLSVPL